MTIPIIKVDNLPEELEANSIYFSKAAMGGESNKLVVAVTDSQGNSYSTPNQTDIEKAIHDTNLNTVTFFPTKAAANSKLSDLSQDQIIEVISDETQSGQHTRYSVQLPATLRLEAFPSSLIASTVNALRDIQYSDKILQIQTLGCNLAGDGGGGVWKWNASILSTTPDNIGIIVRPNSHVGNGAWERIIETGPICPQWFGAKGTGVDDDWAACQAALNYCLEQEVSHLHFPTPAVMYWLSKPIVGTLRTHIVPNSTNTVSQHLTITGGGANTTIIACDNSTAGVGPKGGILLYLTSPYVNETDPLVLNDHTGRYNVSFIDNNCSVSVSDISIVPVTDGSGTGFSFCYDKPRNASGQYVATAKDLGRWMMRNMSGHKPSIRMQSVILSVNKYVLGFFEKHHNLPVQKASWNLPIDISGTCRPHLSKVTCNGSGRESLTKMTAIVKAWHVYGPEFDYCVLGASNSLYGIHDYSEVVSEGGWITNCRISADHIPILIEREPSSRNNMMLIKGNSTIGGRGSIHAFGSRRMWITNNLFYWGVVDFTGSGNYIPPTESTPPCIVITSSSSGRMSHVATEAYLVKCIELLKANGDQNRIIRQLSVDPTANGEGQEGVYELEEVPGTPPTEEKVLTIRSRCDLEISDVKIGSNNVSFSATSCSISPPISVLAKPAQINTVENVNLTNPPTTVNGYSVEPGDVVLVGANTNPAENGLYIVGNSLMSPWVRTSSVNSTPEDETINGMYVWVENTQTGFILTTEDPIVLGTTPLTFSEISAGRITKVCSNHVLMIGGDITGRLTLGSIIREIVQDKLLPLSHKVVGFLGVTGSNIVGYEVKVTGGSYTLPVNDLNLKGLATANADTIYVSDNIYGMNSFSVGMPERRHVSIEDSNYVSNVCVREKVLAGHTSIPPFYLGNAARNIVFDVPNPGYMSQYNNFPSYPTTKPSNKNYDEYKNILVEMDKKPTYVLALTIVNPGTNYSLDDILTIDIDELTSMGGGVASTPAQFKVTSVGLNNRVLELEIINGGLYQPPIVRKALATTYLVSGAGSGCIVCPQWYATSNYIVRNDIEVLMTDSPSFPYEKNTNLTEWVPELSFGGDSTGITYIVQSGKYSINKDILLFEIKLEISNKGSSTGIASILLPLTYMDKQSVRNVVPSAQLGNIIVNEYTNMADITSIVGSISADGQSINLKLNGPTQSLVVTDSHFTNTSTLKITGNVLLSNNNDYTVYQNSLKPVSLWTIEDEDDEEDTGGINPDSITA